MKLKELMAVAEQIAPVKDAESWDNVGLLVGDPDADIRRVLLTIDYTAAVATEATREGCDVVVAYHPPIFQGLKRITSGSLIYDALRAGIAIYSFHTALDVAPGGTNDMLADALGLVDRKPLRPMAGAAPDDPRGMGRIGRLDPIERSALFAGIKKALGVERLLVAGPATGVATSAAGCAGSCGDLIDEALRRKVDVYLTGELRHHDALKAAAAGMTVVCTLHSNSERAVLVRLKERLCAGLPTLDCLISTTDDDPFHCH